MEWRDSGDAAGWLVARETGGGTKEDMRVWNAGVFAQ